MILASRKERRAAEAMVRNWPETMTPVPPSEWRPSGLPEPTRIAVWKSRHFLAQAFDEGDGVVRLSVNRTRLGDDGRWEDGLSWDDLQSVKRQCGFSDRFAVEIYPEDSEVVNVANMRHLWLLPERLPFGWRKPSPPQGSTE